MKMNQSGKGLDEFETPNFLYNQLNAIYQFTLDAACFSYNQKCPNGFAYDKGCDGLTSEWSGRVFCNPPFSKKAEWIRKAHVEVMQRNCDICVMVLPVNSMSSQAWFDWIYPYHRYDILQKRVAFIDPRTRKPATGNNSGTVIVYFYRLPETKEFK